MLEKPNTSMRGGKICMSYWLDLLLVIFVVMIQLFQLSFYHKIADIIWTNGQGRDSARINKRKGFGSGKSVYITFYASL